MRKLIFILFTSLLFFACKPAKKIIPIPEMKLVMWDMISAEEWMKIVASTDSTININKKNISLYNKVFNLHHISKEDFFDSYHYYQSNPNDMKILMDSLTTFGTRTKDTIANHIPVSIAK
jgi:uncharacterized protein YcfL